MEKCKRCLLLEAGEQASYKTVFDYINNLDDELKVSSQEYAHRLSLCKKCEFLIAGMCRKCGCYVEIMAVLKDKSCPNFDNKIW